jgi:dienelactone hydrolase
VHTLRRVSDGALVCPLEVSDISALTASGWKPPAVFRAKGRDGQTDIWGLVFKPSHLDPLRCYPVIENIYAGPQDSFTRKAFSVRDSMQSLAELGFIVVQCDGMGTRNRSKAFHDVCWHNLKDAGLPDRIAWIKALAQKHSFCDTSRVGIYGTSAGGQSSTGGLLFHPEFYKVAVSSCGCHDNRVDKQWWNEQWMGYPVGPWYADSSNIVHAASLRGKLLLIVGELDSNVPPESTLRLTDALMKAGKDFDLLVITGSDHTDGGIYGERRRRDYFVRHLLGVEPPDRNLPTPPTQPVLLPPRLPHEARGILPSGGEGTSVLFRNLTAQDVQLFWISGGGERTAYGTVKPGETHLQNTYAGHAWLVVGANGEELALFVAEPKPGIAEIKR